MTTAEPTTDTATLETLRRQYYHLDNALMFVRHDLERGKFKRGGKKHNALLAREAEIVAQRVPIKARIHVLCAAERAATEER